MKNELDITRLEETLDQYKNHKHEYSEYGVMNLLFVLGESAGALLDEIKRLRIDSARTCATCNAWDAEYFDEDGKPVRGYCLAGHGTNHSDFFCSDHDTRPSAGQEKLGEKE